MSISEKPILHRNFKIFQFGEYFGQTLIFGRDTYQLTHFVITRDTNEAFIFVFAINTVGAALHNERLESGSLADSALGAIRRYLDEGNLEDRRVYTFEFQFDSGGEFSQVYDPAWINK